MGQTQSAPASSEQDREAMRSAIKSGGVEAAKTLLQAHPDLIYVHTRDGENVWHLAAQSGGADAAQAVRLVAAAVDATRAREGEVGRVLAAASAGFNAVNRAAGFVAAAATSAPLPSQLALPMGRDLSVDAQTREGRTALASAAHAGRAEAVGALLEAGADAHRGDNRGNGPLHLAAAGSTRGHLEATRLLLAHADAAEPADLPEGRRLVNSSNLAGLTPLHYAVWRGNRAALRELVNAGASMTARAKVDACGEVSCNTGSTPLHLAAMKGDLQVIRMLLRAHARLIELTSSAAAGGKGPGRGGGGGGRGGGATTVGAAVEHRALRDPRRLPDGYGKTAFTVAFDLGRSEAAALLDPTVPLQRAIQMSGDEAEAPGGGQETGRKKKAMKEGRGGGGGGGSGGNAVGSDAAQLPAPLAAKLNGGGSISAQPLCSGGARGVGALFGGLPVPALPAPPKAARWHPHDAAAASGRQGSRKPAAGELQVPAVAAVAAAEAAAAAEAGATAAAAAATAFNSKMPGGGATAAATATATVLPSPSAPVAPTATMTTTVTTPAAPAAARADNDQQQPPAALVCPITGELLVDPVRASDGRCYEREAIEMWLALGNRSFPGGRARVSSTRLEADDAVRLLCEEWRRSRQPQQQQQQPTKPQASAVGVVAGNRDSG